jgi:hypothetical protein
MEGLFWRGRILMSDSVGVHHSTAGQDTPLNVNSQLDVGIECLLHFFNLL